MSAPPYMKLYVADYLGDTHHLSALEHGAYLLLLMAMWRAGGSLPAADANLVRIARCSQAEWEAIRATVIAYFKVSRGRLTHKRLTAEMAKYENISGKRSEAGRKGGSKKPGKINVPSEANDAVLLEQTESNSRHNQNQNHIESPLPPEGGEQGFELDGGGAGAPPDRRKPRRALPDGFPDAKAIADQQAKAAEQGAAVNATYEAERFRNWAQGKDQRFADWPAAWRNWIVKAINDAPQAQRVVAPSEWLGPAEVKAAVEWGLREYAASYLARCAWRDGPDRALVTASPAVFDRVTRDAGGELERIGVKVVLEQGKAA